VTRSISFFVVGVFNGFEIGIRGRKERDVKEESTVLTNQSPMLI
jgi:hypothetical protein